MSDIAIRVEGLSKQFRIGGPESYRTLRDSLTGLFRRRSDAASAEPFWALKDVSFEIKRGEVVGIIGRNGAGKSTLLKILSRITEPTAGRAEIYGRVGSLLEVGTGFHPELTGRENIFLNGAILGMKRAEILRKFDEIVAFAEVEKFIDTPVKHYSSGMYVRLAFAVAAHLEPDILIIDEVLAVGDSAFQRKCLAKLKDVTYHGRTVVFVSHNLAAIEKLCSRGVLLSHGEAKVVGSMERVIGEYLTQPAGIDRGAIAGANGLIYLNMLEVVNESGEPSIARCGSTFGFAMSVDAKTLFDDVIVGIGINDRFDARVAVLHSAIAGAAVPLEVGIQRITCLVPRCPLTVGTYSIDVHITSASETVLWAPRVGQISVEHGDFYGTGQAPGAQWAGVVCLDQRWTSQGAALN